MRQFNNILAPRQWPLGITQRTRALPSLLDRADPKPGRRLRPQYDSGTFRYVIAWTAAHRPGVIAHRKYLRKIDDATSKVTSQIVLSVDIETID